MPNNDFNGDGLSDLLWRRNDGLLTTWYSTGDGFQGNTGYSEPVSHDWAIAGTGDFDGDGRGDILWRKADGQVTTWLSNGTAFDPSFNQIVDTSWKIETVGDFNGDGLSDIFWRRTDGLVTTWLGNGQGGFEDAVDPLEFVTPDWSVSGTGDFNGDGLDDVLWQKDNLQATVWTSNGTVPVISDAWNQFPEIFSSSDIILHPSFSPGYTMKPGRFSADARDDILLTYKYLTIRPFAEPTQFTYVGLSEGTEFVRQTQTPMDLARYHFGAAIGDYNGDGIDDVARLYAGESHELRVTLVDGAPAAGEDWSDGSMFVSAIPVDWLVITL